MFYSSPFNLNPMRLLVLLVVLCCCSAKGIAQKEVTYNELEKNVNTLAEGLKQDLSVSRDSLVLKNDKLFSKIDFFNENFQKTFYFKPAVTEGKISLQELPLGSYSVMFYQTDKIIVFRINRKSKFENTIQALASTMDAESSDELSNEVSLKSDIPNNVDMAFASNGPSIIDDSEGNKDRSVKRNGNVESDYSKSNVRFNSKAKSTYLEEEGMYSYNLSNLKRDHVQTREEYRSTHLRPNGKPYD